MHRRPSSRDDDYDYDYDDAGCCSVGTDRAMSCLQVLDVSIGISLLVYGSLILRRSASATTTRSFDASASEEEDGAMAAISSCYIFGSVHLTTSALGLYSRHFVAGCRRCGMYASAVGGAYFAFAYFTVVVALLIDGTGFLTYLDEHKEVMYLKSNVYENTERMMPLIYAILIVLGSLEASR
ncbi:hypothetical protein ACHAW5_003037 [Stephanodiscus triporus]|uniref:Uncharacterized protein n=1 Tax=Stephanodiscus triporus TaxID=2934178 RepID=A0ABD3NR01_9STRA